MRKQNDQNHSLVIALLSLIVGAVSTYLAYPAFARETRSPRLVLRFLPENKSQSLKLENETWVLHLGGAANDYTASDTKVRFKGFNIIFQVANIGSAAAHHIVIRVQGDPVKFKKKSDSEDWGFNRDTFVYSRTILPADTNVNTESLIIPLSKGETTKIKYTLIMEEQTYAATGVMVIRCEH